MIQKYQTRLMKTPKCLNYLNERKVSLAAVRKYGVGYFDTNPVSKYMDRMVFPVRDQYGELVGLQGRAMFEWTKERPKYYHGDLDKSHYIYGLYECKELILQKGYVILVEGPFDVIALWEVGEPAVSVLGTALSDQHALILRRYTEHAMLWLDNDRAGIHAATTASKTLQGVGIHVTNVTPDTEKDPSDLWVKGGRTALRKVIYG